ncbi:hypothetical protein [Paraburkholderia diazotrophica]|uniref:hypothetical protein n=1 Tax=Paraburkholderia diazotrophica TaxID=667676 RepID=UPI00115F99CE|nr:hypothetical protein [Paraburkholderia diazotrophica]
MTIEQIRASWQRSADIPDVVCGTGKIYIFFRLIGVNSNAVFALRELLYGTACCTFIAPKAKAVIPGFWCVLENPASFETRLSSGELAGPFLQKQEGAAFTGCGVRCLCNDPASGFD